MNPHRRDELPGNGGYPEGPDSLVICGTGRITVCCHVLVVVVVVLSSEVGVVDAEQ